MEPIVSPNPAAPAAAAQEASRPVFTPKALQPLPKYSVKVALIGAALLPIILLLLTAAVMAALNYNILNWME